MRILASSLLFLLPLAAADKHPWGSFKAGSYAKLKTTMNAGPTKMVTEVTQTLVSVDANNAVVEMETKAMGQTSKTKVPMPLKSTAPTTAPQGKPLTPTNETITVAGKAIACKCYDIETNANGMKSVTHSCTSESVPGAVVRSVTKSTGAMKSETVTELVEFAAK
ncbi:MAG TPA: hypothetical protein VFQ91_27730 [Bryobacteraceae bacterium]|nr:hypothetical protein [Bryobacteraceae bacterium]